MGEEKSTSASAADTADTSGNPMFKVIGKTPAKDVSFKASACAADTADTSGNPMFKVIGKTPAKDVSFKASERTDSGHAGPLAQCGRSASTPVPATSQPASVASCSSDFQATEQAAPSSMAPAVSPTDSAE
eukprot:8914014-Karenia_brevis.AAC.1